MKLIKLTEPPCPCKNKINKFTHDTLTERVRQSDGSWLVNAKWDEGTIVECDCGVQYVYGVEQFLGGYWIKHVPPREAPAVKSWLEVG